tara:strand:- start:1675 stop:2262 length:588 start_codon:yes stop_codon:yes gene_type:complete
MTKKLSLIKYIAFATIVLSAGCGGSNPVSNKEEKTLVLPKPPAMSLIDVSAAGDLESVKKHIAAGTDVNQLDPDEQGDKDSCLGVAAAFGHKNVVLALIEAGADIGYRNKNGSTPLHIAAFFCYPEITQTLIEKGADKNVLDNEGGTALDGVLLPWNQAKSIYEAMNSIFTPLGAPLDYDRIKSTRPEIVDILQK